MSTRLNQAIEHLSACIKDERATPSDHPCFLYKREETDRALEELRLVSGFYRPNN
jgi:hypothetical protein